MPDPYAEFSTPVAPQTGSDPYAAFSSPATRPVGAAMSVNNPTLPNAPLAAGRSWSDVPGEALRNLPESAGNFVRSVVQPFIHPVDTVENLSKLTRGLEKPAQMVKNTLANGQTVYRPQEVPETPEQTAERTAPAIAAGQFFKDRYGSIEGLKNTLATDPVGAAGDAATVLSGGSMLAARAPGVAGTLSRVGALVDPVTATGNALRLGGRLAEPVAANVLGTTTGAGPTSIRAAGRAGMEGGGGAQVFRENMRGQVPVSEVVDTAKSALDKVRQDRAAAYKEGMGSVKADTAVLDFEPVEKAVGQAAKVGDFKGQVIEPKAQGIVAEISDVVNNWKTLDPKEFHTAEGFDALKRTIGNIRDSTQFGTPERVAADRVYRAVRGIVAEQAPEYAKTMEAYAQASDKLKEATRTFSLGEKASGDTAARKLLSATRNNVQTNYGERTRLLNVLAEHEPTLPAAIAGQSLNALAPRGLAARGAALGAGITGAATLNPGLVPLIAAGSPRLMGESAYLGGRGINALQSAAPTIRGVEQGAFQGGRMGDSDNLGTMARAFRKAVEKRNAFGGGISPTMMSE